jgi:hypothetical protein
VPYGGGEITTVMIPSTLRGSQSCSWLSHLEY